MKKLLLIILTIASLSAYAQPGSATYGLYASRVTDTTSTAFTDGLAAKLAAGYKVWFWNEQATNKHWDVYTDAGVEHVFSFAGGGGGATPTLQEVMDEGSTGSVAGPVTIVSTGDVAGLAGENTEIFSTANDIEINSADDIALTVVGTVDITNQVPLLDSVTYLLGRRASDGAIVRKAVSSISGSVTFVDKEVPSGSINSSNVTFTLANTPTAGSEHVYLNGILQESGGGNDYTISGATITYLSAPTTGSILLVSYRH